MLKPTTKGKRVLTTMLLVIAMAVGTIALTAPQAQAANNLTVYYGCYSQLTCHHDITCAWGTAHSTDFVPATGNLDGTSVVNNCTVRVWLYEYADGSGYTLCLNPTSATGTLNRSYKRIYISGNKSNCS